MGRWNSARELVLYLKEELFFLFDVGKDCGLHVEPFSAVRNGYDIDRGWRNGHAWVGGIVPASWSYI